MTLYLKIILQQPTAGVDFGLQKGAGNNYETVQTQRSTGQDLHFDLAVGIKGDRLKDHLPDFNGAFVQGPRQQRFIYIDIGTYAGQESGWSRRLKIPLTGITWEMMAGFKTTPRYFLKPAYPVRERTAARIARL